MSFHDHMKWNRLESNAFFASVRLAFGFFEAFFMSFVKAFQLLRGRHEPLRQSHFLRSLHFFLHDWPKKYWQFPTGIELGRLPGNLLNFLLRKSTTYKERPKGFTLIEMILSVTIFSSMLVLAFSALGNIGIFRTFISSKTDINQELYYAVESVVQTLKNGGDIDYEEYFNRSITGTGTSGGHYQTFSNYGNG